MGRNGAGKSTLLRLAAGLIEPTRGTVERGGPRRAAAAEPRRLLRCTSASATSCRRGARAAGLAPRRPPSARPLRRRAPAARARDRAATASRPAVVCLDEPTRGMDRGHKARARRAPARAGGAAAAAVLVATHDAEFAAAFARPRRPARRRPAGRRRADRRGARRRLVLRDPDRARPRRRRRRAAARGGRRAAARRAWRWPRELGRRLVRCCSALALAAGLRLVRAHAPDARACSRWSRRSPRSPRSAGSRSRRCPNVKPTTDIVLIAGYVLGGAPGFAVGAVAALASNLFFGQGPWTPWQMAAWGGVGLVGAVLARVAGRRARPRPARGRLRASPALVFGAVMNLHLWVTLLGRPHARPSSAPTFATSLPFDLAHAVGNVAVLPRLRAGARARAARATGRGSRSRWRAGAARRARRAARARGGRRRRPRARRRRRRGSAVGPLPRARRRTPTAAGARRPARPPRSSTRAGPRSGSPPPAATRATSARRARSPTSAPTRGALNDLGERQRTILVLARRRACQPRLGGRDLVRRAASRKQRRERLVRAAA